ncbi:hypothetical protein L8P93_25515 [Enterobacter kobei]|uniref:hypothetical protein n=1 Tax=Enterobacter kobei TaxID=208224 RepID=UPI0020030F59|nr:hypothetical protein [Enterobacter kobei]MCK7100885.1 hypothetical protein [Enterobacter kobei]
MSNIDKQALRSTSDCDWFEDWFKREFHPDKTGPYIKEQLFFAVRAARAPLLDELEAKDKSIGFLKDQLAQLANFNPDWDKLEATTDSLREHMAKLSSAEKLIAEHDRKCDEQYLLGMRAGWNFGLLEDADGFDATYASRSKLIEAERAGTAKGE